MMAEVIRPALDQGKTVISDRFVSSTLAYQVGGDGLTERQVRDVAEIAIHGGWPNCVVLLDLPPAASFARINRDKDRIEQRPMEYFERVRKNYLDQARHDPNRYRILLADPPVDVVAQEIMGALALA